MSSFAQNSGSKCGKPALRLIQGGRTDDRPRHVSVAIEALLREIAPPAVLYRYACLSPEDRGEDAAA